MPLAIRYEHDMYLPVVVCDHCGKEIRTAADGNYEWLMMDQFARIYFIHKTCFPAFEQRHGGDWGAEELARLPAFLVNNLGIDWEKSRWMADYLSRS